MLGISNKFLMSLYEHNTSRILYFVALQRKAVEEGYKKKIRSNGDGGKMFRWFMYLLSLNPTIFSIFHTFS
jgi:hypothetical protein